MENKELWFKRDSSSNYVSRGSFDHIKLHLWYLVRMFLFATSPKPFSGYRRWLLNLFGAKVGNHVYISPSVVITIPWFVKIGSHSSIDDECYILGSLEIADYVSISNNVRFLGGEHDLLSRALTDNQKKIVIGNGAFIGSSAIIMPGVKIGQMSVVQAGLCVSRNIKENTMVMAVPQKLIKIPRLSEEDYEKYRFND